MNLWIRSQDKKRLTIVRDLRIYYAKQEDIWVIEDCDDLAYYKTEERALEVLDEIHGCIQTNAGFEMYSNLGQFSDDFNKKYNLVPVYLMPKE